jgi:chemotaxis protein histidine kinase CheA
MDSYDSTASVYAEAKGEYTKQLTLFIVPTFHRFFMNCLKQASDEEANQKRQLWKFQELLSQVPEWNVDKVQREVQKCISEIQCDYLEELVTAVFIAHTKVLTAIRLGNKNKRVQITIPKLDHFLHRALSECSRLLWSSAYLFHNELSPIEKQKNHRQIEALLHDGIGQAIRGLLPVKNILKDYLAEPEGDAEDEEEKEEEKEDEVKEEAKEEVKIEVKEEEAKEEEAKTEEVKTEEAKEEEAKTEEAKTEEAKEEEAKTEEAKTDAKEDFKEILTGPVIEKIELPEVPSLVVPPSSPVDPIALAPPPEQASQQTLIIDTEPSVRFTNYDQVIEKKGGVTDINYVQSTNMTSDNIDFVDDDREPLSDFEDLTYYPNEDLSNNDYEQL